MLKLTQILKRIGVSEKDSPEKMKHYVDCYFNTFANDTRPIENSPDVLGKLQVRHELGLDSEKAKKWKIEKAPTTVVTTNGGSEHARIKYIGIPMGYEFSSLVF